MCFGLAAYVSRGLFALQRDLPSDFSMAETSSMSLAVPYACTPHYSLQMTFQNAHVGSILVLQGGRSRVMACFSQVGKCPPEMLSDVFSL